MVGTNKRTDTPRRAVTYARISLDATDSGQGVERQREACLDLARRNGWEVVDTLIDNSVSATSGTPRPAFEKALALIRDGHADTIIIWHMDRLTRSIRDLSRVLDLRQSCPSLAVVPVQGTPLYASDPSGRMTAEVLAAVAGYEASHLGERVRAKQFSHRLAGELPPRTYGYDSRAEPHPVQAEAVRAAFAAFLESQSLAAAQRALTDADPASPSSRTAVRAMLTRPAYAGIPSWQGLERADLPADWVPLVSEHDYRTASAILSRPSRRYAQHDRRKRSSLGTGLFVCGKCGQTMHQSRSGGKRVYICRGGNDHLRRLADPVDRYALGLLLARLGMADAQATILPRTPDPQAPALIEMHHDVTRRLQTTTDLLADGRLDQATALAAIDRLRKDRDALDARLATLRSGADGNPQPHDPLRAVLAAPLSSLRSALHVLLTLTLHPVHGSPKGLPRNARRPFLLESVTVAWREDLPSPLADALVSTQLDLSHLGLSPDFEPDSVPEWLLARSQARRDAPGLSDDQRRHLWAALASWAVD